MLSNDLLIGLSHEFLQVEQPSSRGLIPSPLAATWGMSCSAGGQERGARIVCNGKKRLRVADKLMIPCYLSIHRRGYHHFPSGLLQSLLRTMA